MNNWNSTTVSPPAPGAYECRVAGSDQLSQMVQWDGVVWELPVVQWR